MKDADITTTTDSRDFKIAILEMLQETFKIQIFLFEIRLELAFATVTKAHAWGIIIGLLAGMGARYHWALLLAVIQLPFVAWWLSKTYKNLTHKAASKA